MNTNSMLFVHIAPQELSVSYASFLYRSGLVVYLLVSCPSIGPALYFIFIYLILGESHLNHFT